MPHRIIKSSICGIVKTFSKRVNTTTVAERNCISSIKTVKMLGLLTKRFIIYIVNRQTIKAIKINGIFMLNPPNSTVL